jgi:hypothetical protein
VEAIRLEQVRWLALKSLIPTYDEGRLVTVAKAIARGLL